MARIPPRSSAFPAPSFVVVAMVAQSLWAIPALGQDVAPPPQALASDPAPPIPRLSATVDPAGMAFGEWGARVELAALPAHGVFVEGGYRSGALSPGIALEVGYHLLFLGEGLDGPFFGPSVGFAVATGRGDVEPVVQARASASIFGALEAGWQLALGPLALGLAAGVEAHLGFDEGATLVIAPRLSVFVGYVLR